MSLISLWVFFVILMILLSLPYIILYFLPYGFITERSFTQMPKHLIIAASCFNFVIFIIPIIISIVMYIVLTKKVKQRMENHRKSCNISVVLKSLHNNPSASSSTTYNLQDLPYPLNTLSINENVAVDRETRGQGKTRKTESGSIATAADANIEDTLEIAAIEKQTCAEIEAALRSMKTNLIMFLFFFVNTFILFIPSEQWRLLIALSFQAVVKFLLPTITMITNFGPVKDVFKMYVNNLKVA